MDSARPDTPAVGSTMVAGELAGESLTMPLLDEGDRKPVAVEGGAGDVGTDEVRPRHSEEILAPVRDPPRARANVEAIASSAGPGGSGLITTTDCDTNGHRKLLHRDVRVGLLNEAQVHIAWDAAHAEHAGCRHSRSTKVRFCARSGVGGRRTRSGHLGSSREERRSPVGPALCSWGRSAPAACLRSRPGQSRWCRRS